MNKKEEDRCFAGLERKNRKPSLGRNAQDSSYSVRSLAKKLFC